MVKFGETCQSLCSEKENICYQEVHAVKNKNLEAVTEEQLQVEPRSIVQHLGVGEMLHKPGVQPLGSLFVRTNAIRCRRTLSLAGNW